MSKDDLVVNGKWEFNELVTDCFDDMLSRSIPDYITMRQLTFNLICNKVEDMQNFYLLDLGCSNGITIKQLYAKYGDKGDYVGIDNSIAMVESVRRDLAECLNTSILLQDVRDFYCIKNHYDIVTSILTLQFTPMESRPALLKRIYDTMTDDGIFILVEKILQPDYMFDKLFVDMYYQMKLQNGYTLEQIKAKRKSLEGVLMPNTHDGNMELLRSAGFNHVDTFWKSLNFEGYIVIKGG